MNDGAVPPPDAFADVAPDPWQRPLFLPGGDDAFVFLVAFGADVQRLAISEDDHRIGEIFAGLDVAVQDGDTVAAFLEPPLGDVLRDDQPELVELMSRTDSCLIIRATVEDPPDLHYLRTCIGVATAAVDAGAVAIYNLQSFGLFGASTWRDVVFAPDEPSPTDFVAILSSAVDDDRPEGHVWLHTRGMRVFGRPDLSVLGVPADQVDLASRLLQALISQMVRGLLVDDDATMPIGPPVGPVSFRRRGHVDDPEFNNVHLELDWPEIEPSTLGT